MFAPTLAKNTQPSISSITSRRQYEQSQSSIGAGTYRLVCLHHTVLLQIAMAMSPNRHSIIVLAEDSQGKKRPKANSTSDRTKTGCRQVSAQNVSLWISDRMKFIPSIAKGLPKVQHPEPYYVTLLYTHSCFSANKALLKSISTLCYISWVAGQNVLKYTSTLLSVAFLLCCLISESYNALSAD
jgi:hypothetical protein